MAAPGRAAGGASAATVAHNAPAGAGAAFLHSRSLNRSHRWGRWTSCFGGLSCFGSRKGGKRIVPAVRVSDGNASSSRGNGVQSGANATQNIANLSILAPPSSPASFTNSALPSTAQSPSCFLSMSANSPGGPSATMFTTGPYAHETQLVTPPVFSTYTTEPSTAPLTPPPELAHATTPSSPDVPYARFLKTASKDQSMSILSSNYPSTRRLRTRYSLYPGSPSSSLISPASATPRTGLSSPFPEQEVSEQWNTSRSACDSPHLRNAASNLFGRGPSSRTFMLDNGFFRPAASAQFHLDQGQQSFNGGGGRLGVLGESDMYFNGGSRHDASYKQDTEETEAYRASFGFSADEIVTTQRYVDISDGVDDSFSISPFSNFLCTEQGIAAEVGESPKIENGLFKMRRNPSQKKALDRDADAQHLVPSSTVLNRSKSVTRFEGTHVLTDDLSLGPTTGEASVKNLDIMKRVRPGQSCSDAEIDYKRTRSLREATGILVWRSSLP